MEQRGRVGFQVEKAAKEAEKKRKEKEKRDAAKVARGLMEPRRICPRGRSSSLPKLLRLFVSVFRM
jgi:hypothetical protein